MEELLEPFESLIDVVDKIDSLVEQAARTRNRKEKQILLQEAQNLADAFQRHCEAGGNEKQQFNRFI